MPDLAEMTRSAMDVASDVLDNAADANPAKAAKDANPKELAVAGIALAALPVVVEQIAKRVAPKVSDLGEQTKEKLSDTASGVAKDAALSKLKQQGVVGRMISNAAGGGVLSKLIPGGSEDDGGGGDERRRRRRGRRAALEAEAGLFRQVQKDKKEEGRRVKRLPATEAAAGGCPSSRPLTSGPP